MIIFIKADGTAVNVVPSPVYQGSSLAGSLYLVAPFPPTNAVSVAFTLANGDYTTEYAMTSISELDGVTDKLGDEYSIWEWQTQNALVTQFAGTVTAQFKVSYNGQIVATSSVNFTVQRGVQPLPPTEPSADEWQAMLELYGSLAGRVSILENNAQRKVLVDFTVNDETGAGIKYYSDGTTADIQFPSGGGVTPVIKSDFLRVLEFTAESWVLESNGTHSLGFGTEQTGYTDNKYFVGLEQSGTETYEAGTETAPSERTGYYTSADTVFKGSDGSLYITANTPYAGRLITLGGVVFTGKIPSAVTYDATTYILTVSYIDGTSESYQLPKPDIAERYNANFTADEWTGSAAPWSVTITAQTHNKGTSPICQTFNTVGEQVFFGVQRASNGDITLYTNEKIAFTITII